MSSKTMIVRCVESCYNCEFYSPRKAACSIHQVHNYSGGLRLTSRCSPNVYYAKEVKNKKRF
jgi:hypothetical protein